MKKAENGFTIVEVSLVLAIAGLIFLMIFVALPALQRQARDTQRKEGVNRLVNAIKKYQTNNRGALPPFTDTNAANQEWNKIMSTYLEGDFIDPNTGTTYNMNRSTCIANATGANCDKQYGVSSLDNNLMYIVAQAKCAGDETKGVVGSANARRFAVLMKMEGGGSYCEDG